MQLTPLVGEALLRQCTLYARGWHSACCRRDGTAVRRARISVSESYNSGLSGPDMLRFSPQQTNRKAGRNHDKASWRHMGPAIQA
jgi:hypothetical protein